MFKSLPQQYPWTDTLVKSMFILERLAERLDLRQPVVDLRPAMLELSSITPARATAYVQQRTSAIPPFTPSLSGGKGWSCETHPA